jgi:hypothetical protein
MFDEQEISIIFHMKHYHQRVYLIKTIRQLGRQGVPKIVKLELI